VETYLIHKKFQETCQRFLDKPALIFQKEDKFIDIKYRDILDYSRIINGFIKEYDIGFGDRAALYMENSPFWFPVYLGIVSSGLVSVPIDYMLGAEEVENILADSQAGIIFCSPATAKALENIDRNSLKGLEIVVIDSSFLKSLINKTSQFLDFKQDHIASLLYTSGTTDNPKAVSLSHKNFMSNFYSIGKLDFYTAEDIFLCILPLHHAYPFTVNLLVPLLSGCSVVFPKSLRGEDIFFCLREKDISIFVGVPRVFSLMNERLYKKLSVLKPLADFLGNIRRQSNINIPKAFFFFVHRRLSRNLRFLISGGAKLDEKVARGLFNLGFDIMEGYGLTETSPVVSFNPAKRIKIGSVGVALPSVSVKIDSPDSSGQGEVVVKADSVTSGYFGRPDLTGEAIRDGWFHTKDLGFIDEDGYLYITGRKDECIVLPSGKNIWPQELEAIYASRPSIKEICVFDRKGSLFAAVVPEGDYFAEKQEAYIYNEIKKDLEEISLQLPPYKRISGFKIVFEELPRTRLGKLRRFIIKEMCSHEVFKDKPVAEEAEDEARAAIIGIIEEFLGNKVNRQDNLELDLGIDSLKKLQLISLFEKKLSINIPDEDLYGIAKVEDLLSYLRSREPQSRQESLDISGVTWGQILEEKPASTLIRRIRVHPSIFDRILGLFSRIIFFSVFKIVYRVKTRGLENIPKCGPFIVCPNHTSYLDGPLVFSTFPFRQIYNLFFMGLSDYFDHPGLSWLVKPGRIVPVNADKNLKESLKVSSFLLRRGKILCIFPEGRRSWDGSLNEFKKGVGILARELSIKIIPVAIKGAYRAWPVSRNLPRVSKIDIIYGEPIEPQELIKQSPEDTYRYITVTLKEKVAGLLV